MAIAVGDAHPTEKIFTMQLKTALVVCILLSAVGAWAQDIHVQRVDGESPIAAYDLAQWSVELGKQYGNPFDPNEIAVDAIFTDEAGKKWVMPAFWDEPPTEAAVVGADSTKRAQWRIRFAPTHAGKWSMVVSAKDSAGTRTSEAVRFEVAASDDPGFVRRSPGSDRYFCFDSGAPYFMVGLNIAWGTHNNSLKPYYDWFGKFSQAGGNFARVWITQARVLETDKSGLGRYDANNAAYFDRVLELAQKDGIRVMLTLNAPGMFGGKWWKMSPYNAANGGPVQDKLDYVKDPAAIQYHEQRLRYLVARYSAYTSLAFWELWNEQEHVGLVPDEWNQRESTYLKTIDPYQHLVTTSSGEHCAGVWPMKTIDLTQVHLYGAADWSHFDEAIALGAASYSEYHKPFLFGEFGITWDWNHGGEVAADTSAKGTALHNAMWASAMTGCAGTAMNWWWDNYIDPKNLWHLFTGISRFSAVIPWTTRDFAPLGIPSPAQATSGDETWSDMNVRLVPAWVVAPNEPIIINANGSAFPAVSAMLFSPLKKELHHSMVLKVDLPKPSTMVLAIDRVSVAINLLITVDGKVADEYKFIAFPGATDAKEVTFNKRFNIYQANLNKDLRVDLPAGEHTIRIENRTGDWMRLKSLTFTGVRSSRYTDLKTYAMQDPTTGDTIAWVLDPDSTWSNDAKGIEPRPREGARLSVPMPKSASGNYTAQWWNTRSGKVMEEKKVEVDKGVVKLAIPTFTRDIALRLYK